MDMVEPKLMFSDVPELLLSIVRLGNIPLDPILIEFPCLPSSVKSVSLDRSYSSSPKKSNISFLNF